MAWPHFKAATESDLYDGQGSYKNIMYRICSLVRKEGQQHAGWCTASERYIAQTTGFSERQVQRAVAQFKKDKVFGVRTYRKGGKEFNHYKPNETLFNSRKRNLEEPVLVSETQPDDTEAGDEEGARQPGGSLPDTVSPATRQVGGVVGITSEVEEDGVNALQAICRTELRSDSKSSFRAISTKALTETDHGSAAPEPPLASDESQSLATSSPSGYISSPPSASPLEAAAEAARSKEKLLADLAKRESVPPPPSKEDLAPPVSAAARPTTPFQIAKALVEETKKRDWDTYLRAYSLAFQFAGYLQERAARGEQAYAFNQWEIMYSADFIDALNRGWSFKDLEDAIDLAQTTKFRFICCTPLRLLDNGESLMKQVYAMRRKKVTVRQKLGERYCSWYLDNAGSLELEEEKQSFDRESEAKDRKQEEELQRDRQLDEDIPIRTLSTSGKIRCITPNCPYRFDTREQMAQHFNECFLKAVEAEPVDEEDALREEIEDAYDDKYGVIPCAYYPWYEEDEAAGRWDKYAAKNADSGSMFNPWDEEDRDRSQVVE